MSTFIDVVYNESKAIKDFLKEQDQISFLSEVDDQSRKSLLLSAASYFESRLTDILLNHLKHITNQNPMIVSFVKNKAISRQYHTYFKWDDVNANQFWGLFGNDFKNEMKELIRNNPKIDEAVKAFLEIGNERNKLVHGNFAIYKLEKTLEEIYSLSKVAELFLEFLEHRFPCQPQG
ncbi:MULTISPECIES: HEPN domain-containing protein [unclassified Paenibacillus]|uniref:HEPN domain-containing protein n=1 Tax=unclassified Paenibacillus TaxID=185978 RepID=UPI001AEA6FEE|nr:MULTISPECIES: HEPN domain-containing protein [unclassified Paenibacillus]MBP1157668.1 hypothetical protein [Paenibacillus sp. PvP091]MBP1171595.1 hypothetical protein [Paenibacillus sp. PvR098]MBP2437976.1 hypothetical protein [Paenibacillus sp. PvP052]